ncbi:MAG: ECF transporter S component [Acutalibacteraceae bacterium]
MNKKFKTIDLAILGIFSALIIILAFTPIGMISFGVVSATTVHIPVIIGAVVLGVKYGFILGLVMGLASLVRAATMPVSVLDPLFVNPLVSVLPRILIGVVTAAVFALLMKLFKNNKFTPIAAGISAVAGTITNTVFVLGILAAIYGEEIATTTLQASLKLIFGTIIGTNGLIEIAAAVVLTAPIATALIKVKNNMKSYR